MIFGSILFFVGMQLAGILIVLPFKRYTSFPFLCITAMLWSALAWCTATVFGIMLTASCTAWFPIAMVGLSALGGILLSRDRGAWPFTRRDWLWLIGSLFASGLAIGIACRYNYSIASSDSLIQILMGRGLVFGVVNGEQLASWGILLPALQAASGVIGSQYLVGASLLFGLVLLATTSFLGWRMGEALLPGSRWCWVTASLPAALLLSTNFIFFQLFYIHNSVVAAAFLLAGLAAFFCARQTQNPAWLYLGSAALTGLGWCRMEGPLYTVIFLSLMLSSGEWKWRTRLQSVLLPVSLLFFWYATLCFMIGKGSDIMSPGSALSILVSLALFLVIVVVSRWAWGEALLRKAHILLIAGLLGALAGALVIKPEHMGTSIKSVLENLLLNGRWGMSWIVIVGLFPLVCVLPRLKGERLFAVGIPVIFLLVMALVFMREPPYRVGFGDSANRILTIALAPALCYLTAKIVAGIASPSLAGAHAMRLSRWARLGIACSLLVVGMLFWCNRPVDLAVGATVVEQPVYSEPDGPENSPHDFSVVVRGRDFDGYAAALEAGPATVTLDLARVVRAHVLEVREYRPSEALTDYAWHVSANGKTWTMVYDTRCSPASSRKVIDAITSRYSLEGTEPFRFVRLTFRTALGQNRLLLRRVRILKYGWGPMS